MRKFHPSNSLLRRRVRIFKEMLHKYSFSELGNNQVTKVPINLRFEGRRLNSIIMTLLRATLLMECVYHVYSFCFQACMNRPKLNLRRRAYPAVREKSQKFFTIMKIHNLLISACDRSAERKWNAKNTYILYFRKVEALFCNATVVENIALRVIAWSGTILTCYPFLSATQAHKLREERDPWSKIESFQVL